MKKETNKIGAEGCSICMDDNEGRSNKALLHNSVQEHVEQNQSRSKIKAVGTILFMVESAKTLTQSTFGAVVNIASQRRGSRPFCWIGRGSDTTVDGTAAALK
jgi:hypothetical protein